MTKTDTGISRPVPPAGFQLVEEICRRAFGFGMLTVLRNLPDTAEIERVHTTDPEHFPWAGRTPMGPTPWGQLTLHEGKGWWGGTPEAVRWAFPDSGKILSLGYESLLCAPVLDGGRTIGILSLNDTVERYSPADLDPLGLVAQALREPILAL